MNVEQSWNSYQQNSAETQETDRLAQDISTHIQRISQNVITTERMVNQLGTAQDNEQLRAKLHDLEHETKTLSQKTADLLSQFKNLTQPTELDEQRRYKLLREKLTGEFATVLNRFKSVQLRTAEKEKASVIRAKYDATEVQTPATALSPQQRTQIEQNVDIQTLKERQEAIVQLESDISDVNQIFKDLALMVHDQGEMLDSIEANVDNAQIHVQQGVSQVAKAAEYQRKVRKKRFICLVALVVSLVVLAIIIYLSTKH